MSTRSLVVAHDFSPCADAAADEALEELRLAGGGRLVLVHVYVIPTLSVAPEGGLDLYAMVERSVRSDAEDKLKAVAARLAARAKNVDVRVDVTAEVSMGSVAEGVIEAAQRAKAQRIFVGTHGRRGLAHVVLGSVAEHIARMSSIPVVVVRAKPA